jgi:hypothetical protein
VGNTGSTVTDRAPGRGARAALSRALAVGCAVLTITLVSACAAVPDGGVVTSATMAQNGDQSAGFVQMIPSGPQPGWDPGTIVYGFLLASADFTNDHAIAREYLTPSAARTWRPGSSVLEFSGMPTVSANSVSANTVTMQVTGNLLGTISEDGQYQAAEAGVSPTPTNITVVRVKGQWRIINPPGLLLFSQADVGRAFRSRDLYFFDQAMATLVPEPVYVPAEASAQQLVAHLVAALQQGPQGWLKSGTRTAFPSGTALLGTSVTGSTAIVNLGGHAAETSAQQRQQMADQLLQTLASAPAYPQPDATSIQSVVFEINGQPVHLSCAALQLSICQPPLAPAQPSHAYYVDAKGHVAALFGARSDSPLPGPAAAGHVQFDKIAVSTDQMTLAGVSGDAVYTGDLTQDGTLTRQLAATAITSLSWDSAGGLWIVGRVGHRTQVWRLVPGGMPMPVSVPAAIGRVTVLRVAPDGVRVAMVTGSGARARMWLAAIVPEGRNHTAIGRARPSAVPIGTDVTHVTDLIWYDTGDVIALTQPSSGSLLYEVPVDGGPSRPIATEPDTVSVAASTDGQLIAASDGTLLQLSDLNGSIWRPAGAGQSVLRGQAPVYPG